MIIERARFGLSMLARIAAAQDMACPYCGSRRTRLRQRKMAILQLRRCDDCALLFRWPKDSLEDNRRFYQRDDPESVTYRPPGDRALDAMIAANFRHSLLDYSLRVEIVGRYLAGGRVLDYGASWGYGVHQFRKAGYDAVGFETSEPRAAFGRRSLGVQIETDTRSFPDREFDLVHTAHVLEHIPDLKPVFAEFRRLLKPGGLLLIFVPNGDGTEARTKGVKWGPMISEKHVAALSGEFFARALPHYGFSVRLASSPYDREPVAFATEPLLDGEELMVIGVPDSECSGLGGNRSR